MAELLWVQSTLLFDTPSSEVSICVYYLSDFTGYLIVHSLFSTTYVGELVWVTLWVLQVRFKNSFLSRFRKSSLLLNSLGRFMAEHHTYSYAQCWKIFYKNASVPRKHFWLFRKRPKNILNNLNLYKISFFFFLYVNFVILQFLYKFKL
jgi:hypothetical protein